MTARITLRNYRCFTHTNPAVFDLGEGFTSFVGPNNSGKSTLLRFFYEMRGVISHFGVLRGRNFSGFFGTGPVGLGGLPPPITDQSEIVYEAADGPLQFQIDLVSQPDGVPIYVKTVTWTYHTVQQSWELALFTSQGNEIRSNPPNGANFQDVQHPDQNILLTNGAVVSFAAMVELTDLIAKTQYLGPFRNAVNEGAGSYYDLQLGTSFVEQWHHWKTGGDKSKNRAISKVTEDIRRLINANALEINASIELKTLQLSIDGRPFKLSELGSGVAQLVVVLGNVLVKKPSFVAIDEPETHLHPSLQLDFLTTLASYTTHGVLYSTHSLGLARASSDRTYSVKPSDNGSILRPYERTANYAEFLGSMGIAGLQDIGMNKILLVEGPTDVRTYQQLLRKYGKDREVVILPLGGDSMINGKTTHLLEEVLRLCPNVFAVIDSEKKSREEKLGAGRRAFQENCLALNINLLILGRRATENYLTDRCVKQEFGDAYTALGDFGATSDVPKFWGKTENWRAARKLTREELDQTDIGEFLSAL